jgi:dTDP-4-amino-4,6-dideoxygalactose transaminase
MNLELTVPFGALARVNDQYISNIAGVLDSGKLVGGEYVEEFEEKFATYVGSDHCVSVASGMDALQLGIQALELPPRSKVCVVDIGGGYASLAVLSSGHIPVFCDINPLTSTLDFTKMKESNVKPAAIIVTHLYGQINYDEDFFMWAQEQEIFIIEDCAQASGAKLDGKMAGTFGILSCFSFYPTKNLGGIGDGGAICTSQPQVATKLKQLKNYGWGERYNIQINGGRNSRLDAINAAVLLEKLKILDNENSRRRTIFEIYREADSRQEFFPDFSRTEDFVAHLAVGRALDSIKFRDYFLNNGIETSRHYPYQDSAQPGLNQHSDHTDNPHAQNWCSQVVTLPIYPDLKEEQIQLVSSTLKSWLNKERA